MENNTPLKNLFRGPLPYLLAVLLILLAVMNMDAPSLQSSFELGYSELLEWVRAARDHSDPARTIKGLIVQQNTVYGITEDSTIPEATFSETMYDFRCTLPGVDRFYADLQALYGGTEAHPITSADYDFTFSARQPAQRPWWMEFVPYLLMMALFGAFMYYLYSKQMGGRGMTSIGRARMVTAGMGGGPAVTFDDVAGAKEEKEELEEIVSFLKDPARFTGLGAKIPTGVILVGPPGTGKTLLARAVAGEAGVPFFSLSGSDFVEMFVGVGASRVRDLFDQAKRAAPSIIFIDEIDAVGRQRGTGLGGGHDEREQTLNQLLVEMDGFSTNQGVIVMAATNRVDVLDPALLRPGRFDRRITVNYPDVLGREEILKVHAKGKPLGDDVDLKVLARRTPYFTGADLMNVMNEAALLAARGQLSQIGMPQIEEAITRVMAGPEKKSRRVTEADRRLVAYHEGGHAIVSYYIPECDSVHEITTIPRGQAGGYTMYLPQEEFNFVTTARLRGRMASLMGGRVAEAIVFGDVSTGASSDIRQATEIARGMVTQYGMSARLGPVYLSSEQEVFLGKTFAQQGASLSEKVTGDIDSEVHALVDEAYRRAEAILTQHRAQLEGLAALLIEREKLDREQFESFMRSTSSGEGALPSA